ncbi:MAG: hydroxymethylbilane synthase [Phascolarctobacterium sp.]|uniref:hydroxymethylbilane synthase n=1 Tax=Phascolarctobacterium sp. TaxID=2049039 RepID=UPI0026DB7553|nr:hydroxymethylbilane synthase [Phascolarctobacterium sp.]MDO4921785.1 hydroxymethylbilane synthase [Phascolarctobacterium sp.]
MKAKLKIGTRQSLLALWQSNHIAACLRRQYPECEIELKKIVTKGDKILDVPLAQIGGKGLFTKEIEEELLSGEIDLAVHSLKDMPTVLPEGLCLTAITTRANVGDAFVSNKYASFAELPLGAVVGTSSLRRRAQLLAARPDLDIRDLRGNVDTRLRKLDEGLYDAVILAAAGLERLGHADRIQSLIPSAVCLPAVGQGALAIECRDGDKETRAMLDFLNDLPTRQATGAERAFLGLVEGGCQVPIGVHADVEGNKIRVEAIIAALDGSTVLRDTITGSADDAVSLGQELGRKMLANGGREILAAIL